jgi:prevent-host-death family protein
VSYPPLKEPLLLNVHDAKTHLSQYLARVEQGETIVLCRRNRPVAEIRPLKQRRSEPRPLGLEKGRFEVGTAFDEPLPDTLLEAFAGMGGFSEVEAGLSESENCSQEG